MNNMEKDIIPLLQDTGDRITRVFEQMIKSNWQDDHGHDVRMNVAMLDLRLALSDIGKFRERYLGYPPFNVDHRR